MNAIVPLDHNREDHNREDHSQSSKYRTDWRRRLSPWADFGAQTPGSGV